LSTPLLPQEVQQQGLFVAKATINFLAVMNVYSEDGSRTSNDLGDLIYSQIQDPVSRVLGVGETFVLGTQYSMRICLDPHKMKSFNLTTTESKSAIRAQNAQVAAGQLGARPFSEERALNATVTAQTRLTTPEEFRNIVLRTNSDGSTVRLADVARVEIGGESYAVSGQLNGKPAAGLAIRRSE